VLKALVKKIFGGNDKKSRSLAKSRLHFVLVQDRTGLTNDQMAQFRKELVEVIQRYFTIDETGFDISYERHEESTTLLINSPVVVKRQEAIGGKVGSSPKSSGTKNGTEGIHSPSSRSSATPGATKPPTSEPVQTAAAPHSSPSALKDDDARTKDLTVSSSTAKSSSGTAKSTGKAQQVGSQSVKQPKGGKRVRRQKKRRASRASSASANA